MRVLITRPEADAAKLAGQLASKGIEGIIAPLLDIEFTPGPEPEVGDVQALLFTSANGVRAFCQRSPVRNIRALCVGDVTALEADTLGFKNVKSATGNVETLTNLVKLSCAPEGGVLLHAAGTRVAGDLTGALEKAGFKVRREVLYEARMAERLPDAAAQALSNSTVDWVVLYSPRTASHFAELVLEAGLGDKLIDVRAACLSKAVADKVSSLNWVAVEVAAKPDHNALLALLKPRHNS